jgi:hypothetical protein
MAKKSEVRKPRKAGSSKPRAAQKSGRKERSDNVHGQQQKVQEPKTGRGNKKLTEGNKSKNGCFPKLLMLLLPCMAVGAYLFLVL